MGVGHIGLRLTCCVSKLRIIKWMKSMKEVLTDCGLQVWLAMFYVDDIRFVMSPIPRGWGWDRKNKKLTFSEDRERQDLVLNLRPDDRTAQVLLEIMNDREPDLTFTMETMSMFESKEIPTLDFTL